MGVHLRHLARFDTLGNAYAPTVSLHGEMGNQGRVKLIGQRRSGAGSRSRTLPTPQNGVRNDVAS